MVQIKRNISFKTTPCNHSQVIRNSDGYKVCTQCGEVLKKENFPHGSYISEKPYSKFRQFTVISDSVDRKRLGSHIDEHDLYTSKQPLNITYFTRLKKRNSYSRITDETEHRILNVLRDVCSVLNIPHYVRIGAAYRYNIIRKSKIKIINNITAICYCLWHSIQHHTYFILTEELLNTFNELGHRLKKRLLIRDGLRYQKAFTQQGIPKPSPKTSINFLPAYLSKLRLSPITQKRIKYKKLHTIYSVNKFLIQIEKLSFKLYFLMKPLLQRNGFNPSRVAPTIIYTASELFSDLRRYKKKILPPNIISKIMGIPEYTIRDLYGKLFKPRYKKLLQKLQEAEYDTE